MVEKKSVSRQSKAGKKAWKETITPTELGYIEKLIAEKKANEEDIFHHKGTPDIMHISTETGKVRFYEVKPEKGSKKRTHLNPSQSETIKKLLEHRFVEGVTIVYYKKNSDKTIEYRDFEVTLENVDSCSLSDDNA